MYKKPKLRFFLVLAAFLAVFITASNSVYAAKSQIEGRYFIASKSYFIKSLFGVQHEFDKGFTADLTTGEVWTLNKIFKTEVTPVPLYKVSGAMVSDVVLPMTSSVGEMASIIQNKEDAVVKDFPKRSSVPNNSITWGIKKIYNDESIKSTSGGKGVNIVVLDTGANIKHYDLVNRIKDCKDFTRGPIPRSTCEDKHGHGTHMAGIIAADGGVDGKGIFGVASEANLLIYKVCRNDGTCWADDVASALNYASANNTNIVSMGLGGDSEDLILREAINNAETKNILVVAATGNNGPDKDSIDWPAAYTNVVAVGAIAEDGLVPDWSSRGINNDDYVIDSQEVELAAPGVNVESTWLDGGYRYLSGTSLASAYASGLAAKLWDGSATSTMDLILKHTRDIWTLGDDTATGLGLPFLPKTVSPSEPAAK